MNKVFIDLNEWVDRNTNPRIDGFSKLQKANAVIPDIKIVTGNVFKQWLKNNKKFEKSTLTKLKDTLKTLLSVSPSKTLMIRQAYYIPDIQKPFGSRYSATSVKSCIKAIEDHYKFFIKNKYHTHKNSECILFLYGRIDPPPLPEIITTDTTLPRGGMASLIKPNVVEIHGTFGDNETVNSFNSDTFMVILHSDRMVDISESNIKQKRHMLIRPPIGEKPLQISVPEDRQLRSSLTPSEIETIAKVVSKVSYIAGVPQRVEFSYGLIKQSELTIVFNETAPFEQLKNGVIKNKEIKGVVEEVIDNARQAKEIVANLKKGIKYDFIVITPKLVSRQDEQALLELENSPSSLKILYPGTQSTTHRDQILRQMGHHIYLYGINKLSRGDRIQVTFDKGSVNVRNISNKESPLIIPLEQGFLAGLENIGGKALRLSELCAQDILTPGGFIILVEGLKQTLINSNLYNDWLKAVKANRRKVGNNLFKKIRKSELITPKELNAQISQAVKSFKGNIPLFIRSSSLAEDSPKANFAGKYLTLDINNPNSKTVINAYKKVVVSAFSEKVINFSRMKNVDLTTATQIAVLIQPDVKAIESGVVFRKDPQGSDNILIEAVKGRASGVVTGTRVVERILSDPLSYEVISRTGPKVLKTSQVKALVNIVLLLTKIYNQPQDVEWGFNREGQLIILQSRDQR